MNKYKGSTSVDLDKITEIAKINPENAILMLVAYLRLRERKEKK